MRKEEFARHLTAQSAIAETIKQRAHAAHAEVNQHYDGTLPYSVHLDAVAANAMRYAHEVCDDPTDIIPILFGAYFHDSIEDARLTYKNVLEIARELMDDEHALMATEIAYALTNEKGRTRAERANDKYYAGIRATPYAPLCKMADRLANAAYSARQSTAGNSRMKEVYASENSHFVEAVTRPEADDPRMRVPDAMVEELRGLLSTTR